MGEPLQLPSASHRLRRSTPGLTHPNPRQQRHALLQLEAEGRALSRQLAGYTADRGTPYAEAIPAATGRRREAITADLKENRDQLTYWQAVRAQQVQDGATAEYGPETIPPGDKIRAAGTWWTVARVNKVTCSVWADPGRRVLSSYRVRYTQVSEHRPG